MGILFLHEHKISSRRYAKIKPTITMKNELLKKWADKELELSDLVAFVNSQVTEEDNLDGDERKQIAEKLFSIYNWDAHGTAIDDFLVSLLKDKFSQFMENARYVDRKACRIYHDFVWQTAPPRILTNAKQLR